MGLLLLFLPSFSQNLITNPSLDWRDCNAETLDDVDGWFSNKNGNSKSYFFNGCIHNNPNFYERNIGVKPYHGESYLRQERTLPTRLW